MSTENKKLISIICPVFNEEEAVPLFYNRLQTAIAPLRDRYDFELIFTNNRSSDRTLSIIHALREKDPSVYVLTLSRNFGYQGSVQSGLQHARGDGIVVIDVDCEDPPEMIPRFIAEWEKGSDVVYGRRDKRPEPEIIQLMRKIFYRLSHRVADSDFVIDMAEFSIVSSHVRDVMLQNKSTFPFLRTEIGYVGFERKGIPYTREARVSGKTHYNLLGMAQFAIGGILSSSTFLLRLPAYYFPLLFVFTAACLVLDLTGTAAWAFRALVAVNLLSIMFFLTIICIYMARIYKNGVSRPVFVVDQHRSILPPARRS